MNVWVCIRNNHNHYLVIKDKVLEGCLVCSFKYRVLISGLKSLFVGVSSDKRVSRIRFKDWDRTVISGHRAEPHSGRYPHQGHYPLRGRYPHRGRRNIDTTLTQKSSSTVARVCWRSNGAPTANCYSRFCVCVFPFVCVRELIGLWVLNHQFTCLLYTWICLKNLNSVQVLQYLNLLWRYTITHQILQLYTDIMYVTLA